MAINRRTQEERAREDLEHRCQVFRERLAQPDFLANKGIGNEIGFYTFCYDPSLEFVYPSVPTRSTTHSSRTTREATCAFLTSLALLSGPQGPRVHPKPRLRLLLPPRRRDLQADPRRPPIAHWVTRLLVCAFECGISIDSLSDYTGSQNITADNDRFLRKWWETASFGAGLWAPCSKGGNFTRWFGNNEYAIDWSDKAREFYRNSSTSNLLKKQHWFKEGIAYSDIASGKSPFPLFTCTGYL